MEMKNSLLKNTNGTKALVTVTIILSIIAGIAAIVRPMQNEINGLHERIERMETRFAKSQDDLDINLQREFHLALEPTKQEITDLKESIRWLMEEDKNNKRVNNQFEILWEWFKRDMVKDVGGGK